MTSYAVVWHPHSDNLGDDLLTLAASRLLPRVDRVLDAQRLDDPMADLEPDDRIVTLLCGKALNQPVHWPPERHIAPVVVGAHFAREDVWGVPLGKLQGAGLDYLRGCGVIGCRDDQSVKLMEELGIPCRLTACLTLTLERPQVEKAQRPYIVCCDMPAETVPALEHALPGYEIREVSHIMEEASEDYQQRMLDAHERLKLYAGAKCVLTRRLHCAMACLAVDTPVMMLYHADYEDVEKFAPISDMMITRPLDQFLEQVKKGRFVPEWKNPPEAKTWKAALIRTVEEGIAQAEKVNLPIVSPEEGRQWRSERLMATAHSAARKIQRLERIRYEALHEKFTLVLREDTAKSAITTLLNEPEVRKALNKTALRRYLSMLPWYKRPLAWLKVKQGRIETEDLYKLAMDVIKPLGWPDGNH